MKLEGLSGIYDNFAQKKEEKSTYIKPMPFDSFIPSKKSDEPKKAKGGFFSSIVNFYKEADKKFSAAAEVCKAIDKSTFFTDKKQAKTELLKDLDDYDPQDIVEKIKMFEHEPFIKESCTSPYCAINYVIKNNELTPNGANQLLYLTDTINRNHLAYDYDKVSSRVYDFYTAASAIKEYPDFDSMIAKDKCELIERKLRDFSQIDFEKIKNAYSLKNTSLIKDMIEAGSVKNLQDNLRNKMLTGGVKKIDVEKEFTDKIADLNGVLSLDNLSNVLNNMNLDDYKNGIPLKYSRDEFVSDFKSETDKLTDKDKKEVYKYFNFNIDDESKMSGYPVLNSEDISNMSFSAQKAVQNCNELIQKYLMENEANTGDANSDETINAILKAFPEFTVVIGNTTHRGEALDYHTLKVLKGVINNPDMKTLSPENQRITILSTLFHDFSKREKEIDKTHPMESARYVNTIIKKLPISSSEKERIYTLVQHSHWAEELSENKADKEDIATYFRNPDDFKMAQILAKADIESNEYTKNVFGGIFETSMIEEIEQNIAKIHTNGNLVYNTKFPYKQDLFPKNKDGIKVLDFTDADCDLGQYGFEKGMTPKDLKSYIHCPPGNATPEKMLSLCDDKQDVILSTTLFNRTKQYFGYSAWNHSDYVLMLDAPNSNIVLGGPNVSGTGGARGYDYFKKVMFEHEIEGQISSALHASRKEMPNIIKNSLSITDDEYKELYEKIANMESLEQLPCSITLSNGKILSKEDIIKATDELYSKLFDPKNLSVGNGYQNEICIYKPKIQAFAVRKQTYDKGGCPDKVIQAAKKYDIPIVLV